MSWVQNLQTKLIICITNILVFFLLYGEQQNPCHDHKIDNYLGLYLEKKQWINGVPHHHIMEIIRDTKPS